MRYIEVHSMPILCAKIHIKYRQNETNLYTQLNKTIQILKVFNTPHTIQITIDSNYIKKCITKRISNWKINNWKTSKGKPVKHKDLWIKLDKLLQKHKITWD